MVLRENNKEDIQIFKELDFCVRGVSVAEIL